MSKNTNRQMSHKVTDNHSYRILFLKKEYPPYYDDGYNYYLSKGHRKGHRIKKKRISKYQYRVFRTWKHNRETQWK